MNSYDGSTGKYNQAFNMFHYDSEFKGFAIGAAVKPYETSCGGRACTIGPKDYNLIDKMLTTTEPYKTTNSYLLFGSDYPQ